MTGWINKRFGTPRGLARLALAHVEVLFGATGEVAPDDEAAIRRLVFLCHGNICRSAYAQGVASAMGFATAGFGLSTSEGKGAHPPVLAAAASRGIDLSPHRSVRVEDFEPQPGDLLLGMETGHLRKLSKIAKFDGVPRLLLGEFVTPAVPHIHDPYGLSDAYLPFFMDRIDRAVASLVRRFPNAAK